MNITSLKPLFDGETPPLIPLTPQELAIRDAEQCNQRKEKMTDGVDCPICGNKQVIYYAKDGYLYTRPCECQKRHISIRHAKASGMGALLEKTFDNFQAVEPWQIKMLEAARMFADNTGGGFYVGGQSGCGKTHICAAISNELIKQGYFVLYMPWVQASNRLKASKGAARDSKPYDELIKPYKECDVLYIDDFFKVQQGTKPTAADITLAFDILNSRLIDDKSTIISSEFFAADIVKFDEAVGGRVMEMTRGRRLSIAKDPERNQRLKDC